MDPYNQPVWRMPQEDDCIREVIKKHEHLVKIISNNYKTKHESSNLKTNVPKSGWIFKPEMSDEDWKKIRQ